MTGFVLGVFDPNVLKKSPHLRAEFLRKNDRVSLYDYDGLLRPLGTKKPKYYGFKKGEFKKKNRSVVEFTNYALVRSSILRALGFKRRNVLQEIRENNNGKSEEELNALVDEEENKFEKGVLKCTVLDFFNRKKHIVSNKDGKVEIKTKDDCVKILEDYFLKYLICNCGNVEGNKHITEAGAIYLSCPHCNSRRNTDLVTER